ncbi:MAG: ATP-dependent Clp protease proteolytic subunit [bacterium]|nr:ATP-dependent Clp protease proteolytic subunit [bacterium]
MSHTIADAAEKSAKTPGNDRLEDLLLFNSRMILVFGEINEKQALTTCTRLQAMCAESDKPISMLISSPGGHVESGDAIHNMIRFVSAPVTTIGTGWVGSAAAHIFLAPPKERRLCLPHTRFLIHQPAGGIGGQATEIAIQAAQIVKTRERIARVIATQTGQPLEKVAHDIERDFWMDAAEAMAYGIVLRVVERQADLG